MARILITIFFLTAVKITWAYQLKGVVRDTSGNPVPYASVFVQNTTYGVATNLKGEYFLELESGNYKIVFQAVGFQKKVLTVRIKGKSRTKNVVLTPAVKELKEVEVSAEQKDPAYAIVKKAVENRQQYRDPADAYSYEAYIKANLQKEFFTHDTMDRKARDTLPNELTNEKMNFYESYSQVYFQQPNNRKEVKTAVKDLSEKHKGSFSISVSRDDGETYSTDFVNRDLFKVDLSEATFDFYYNNVSLPSLGEVPFVSPLSNVGLLSYKFKLEETFLEDSLWINKIKVIPRREEAALFKGYIYIVDDWWNIKAVDLEPDDGKLFHFDDFRVLQDYKLVEDSIWMLNREEFFYNAKEGKKHLLGTTLIKYSNYNLDPEFDKNFFKNELRTITDDAYDKDSVYWNELRPVTLKKGEKEYIALQDSIKKYHESAEFLAEKDSIYNRLSIWDFLLNGVGFRNSFKKRELYFNPLIESMYFFGIGGYRHAFGGRVSQEFSKAYELSTHYVLNYGFHNRDLKGSVGFDLLYMPKKFGRLHGEYRNSYEMINTYESLSAMFSRGNYVNDIFYSFGHEMELVNGLFADVTVEYGEKHPIDNLELSQWSQDLFGEFNQPESFEPYSELILDVRLRYTFGQKYYTAPYKKINLPSKWPTITLWYKRGIPGFFDSSVNFDFLEFRLKEDVKLGTFGLSRFNFYLGSYLRSPSVRFTDYKFFRGSDPFFYSNPLKSFQLLGPSISTKNPYMQVHYLHHFNGAILNKIPLVKKAHLQLTGGVGVLMIQDEGFKHAEAFAGIEWPFRIRRQLMKIGGYYVVADSNYSTIDHQFKFGIDFFNSFTNKWSY